MANERTVLCLMCETCKDKNYYFVRGKKKEYKVALKKFCKNCGKRTPHKETKAS